jgi:phosphomannomutase
MPAREHLLKIGVSGIRGVVGEFLTPALACAFAEAFGTYVGGGRVVVGRDTRSSGPMLQHAVQCGLLATGCDVVDVGVLPTPTIQVYVAATGARGGIALTASHNPPEYNALKLFNAQGLFFNNYERGELIDLYHQSAFRRHQREMRRAFATTLA